MCCKSFWKIIVPFGVTFALGLLSINTFQKENPVNIRQENVKPLNKVIHSNERIGLLATNILAQENSVNKNQKRVKPCNQLTEGSGEGNGMSMGDTGYSFGASFDNKPSKTSLSETKPLQITSKPIAKYTDKARENCIEGVVILKITFFANGKVGNFSIINGLPYGLNGQAIAAARQIKFEPATIKGKAITVSKKVKYNFTIY